MPAWLTQTPPKKKEFLSPDKLTQARVMGKSLIMNRFGENFHFHYWTYQISLDLFALSGVVDKGASEKAEMPGKRGKRLHNMVTKGLSREVKFPMKLWKWMIIFTKFTLYCPKFTLITCNSQKFRFFSLNKGSFSRQGEKIFSFATNFSDTNFSTSTLKESPH